MDSVSGEPRIVKQGKTFAKGIRLESTEGPSDISWGRVRSLRLGRIQGEGTRLFLELRTKNEPFPYLIDSATTDLSKFVGQDATGSSAGDLAVLIRKIVKNAPHVADGNLSSFLVDGPRAAEEFQNLAAFNAATQRTVSRPPARPRPHPQRGAPTPPPESPGIGAFFLTVGYMLGIFLAFLAVWTNFLKANPLAISAGHGLGYWIGAGSCLTLSGLGTLKARDGRMRSYLAANIWMLRGWFVMAAVGFVVVGITFALVGYGSLMAIPGLGLIPVSKGALKLSAVILIFLVCVMLTGVLLVLLALNMLVLALLPARYVLDGPTILDLVGFR